METGTSIRSVWMICEVVVSRETLECVVCGEWVMVFEWLELG